MGLINQTAQNLIDVFPDTCDQIRKSEDLLMTMSRIQGVVKVWRLDRAQNLLMPVT